MPTLRILAGLVAVASVATSAALPNSIASRLLVKNVAIVGGGASGSHAALRLKEDFGQSVVVIEKADHLGGHVAGYDDAATGRHIDYGVDSFNDYGSARAFFTRLGVSVQDAAHPNLPPQYVDFATGDAINYTAAAIPDMFGALGAMYGVVKPFENLISPSYASCPAPANVPADLLLLFGEFVTKYSLEAAINQIFQITGHGVGDLVNTPTMYVLQAFGIPTLESFLGIAGVFVPSSGRNIEIYEAIATRLGSDVLYSSTVVQSLRTMFGVVLWVKGPDDKYTLVLADKLLVAMEPTESNIEPFNPSPAEQAVFNKLSYSTPFPALSRTLRCQLGLRSSTPLLPPHSVRSRPPPSERSTISCFPSWWLLRG
ncbi:hypothetical protein OQA88_10956 [Cercophora sp. LCS_1]